MKLRFSLSALVFGLMVLVGLFPTSIHAEKFEYIRNDSVELGVLMDFGAGIASFGKVGANRNLLNHADPGRLVQQSFYGDVDGSNWNGTPWRWNPVQGGCWKGNKGIVLDYKNDGRNFYAKTKPLNWGGCEEIDATMEEWIELAGNVAHIRFKFTNGARNNTATTHQEMPAVFVDYALKNLVYYEGASPWTGAPLTRRVPGWPNSSAKPAEQWAAYVDSTDWGIGVFTPGTSEITCYRYEGDMKTGPTAGACSYFAPVRLMTVVKAFSIEYSVYLYIGKVAAMRKEFSIIYATGLPSQPYVPTALGSSRKGDGSRTDKAFTIAPGNQPGPWHFRYGIPERNTLEIIDPIGRQEIRIDR